MSARFGLSTHLFHGERLQHDHLSRVADGGFRTIEVFATRTHVDYHDAGAVTELAASLNRLGLVAWSMHAPICDGFLNDVWGRAYSNATRDEPARREAIDETIASIRAAGDLGCSVIVLHLGIPRGQPIASDDNDARALARSLEPIAGACARAGVRLALEVIPNDLATPDALVRWLEGDLDLGNAGACLDVGHAHMLGGAVEAAEALSGYVLTTHLHDNNGQSDDHLLPFEGTLDWAATLTALSKVGYAGPLIFEVPNHGDATRVLDRLGGVCRRLQAILDDLAQPMSF